MAMYRFFATTAKELEVVLAEEMKRIGLEEISVEKGGVRFTGDLGACYRANLWLRTAHRVLVSLDEFHCETPQQLYDGVRSIAWHEYLTPEQTLAVDCNLRDSGMTHSGYAALKAKDAVVDSLREHYGRRPNVDVRNPDLRINLHISRNCCIVSLDSSGDSLDKRGYRLEAGEAPLRETLAAALVELSGWDGTVPLVDPMCGAGTICIEAAMMALKRAPGMLRRRFGFQNWPSFDRAYWENLVREAEAGALPATGAPIIGSDVSSAVLDKARRNAKRAGVEKSVSFMVRDISEMRLPEAPGILVFNPPYGERIGETETLKLLYKRIGDTLKQQGKGYTAYLFTGNPELGKWVGLKASRKVVLYNGPIECRLLKYELY